MALSPPPSYGPGQPSAAEGGPPPSQPSWFQRLAKSPATIAVFAVNLVVFGVAELSGSTQETETLIRFGANNRVLVFEYGEWWRLVSSMFLHIGLIHLAVNTYFGFGWSTRVEQWFGATRFLVVYLLTGIIASLTSALAQNSLSAGASGALFGMIGVTLAVLYNAHGNVSGFFKDPGVRATLINLAILLALGIYVLPLDNWAHGGGLVSGFAAGFILVAEVKRKARRSRPRGPDGWEGR